MTDKPKTITVDGITYTRAEEPCPLSLLILHRGFIYVGEIVECHSDALSVKNAANVRKWERGGIGGLTIGAKSSGATLDACADFSVPDHAIIAVHALAEGWRDA